MFWEELDLLKLNELGCTYPHSEEPLMWALNKQYWYYGEFMFEAKGASIYGDAKIEFAERKEGMSLKPVNIKRMIEKNKEFMFLLESEAIEFIHETFEQYVGARKSIANVVANQLDYEVLAAKWRKRQKRKMAIVKADCDSLIMSTQTNIKGGGIS